MSASGLVSIVFGLVNDDPKHHVGLVDTWEHPAFNFASNPKWWGSRGLRAADAVAAAETRT